MIGYTAQDLRKIEYGSKFQYLFDTEKKVVNFTKFMDIKAFNQHLKEHELSLVFHSSSDSSPYAIERTKELYKDGIDIFRLKGD